MKNTIRITIPLLTAVWLCLFAVTSCEKDKGPLIIEPDTTGTSPDPVSFKNDIQPIFKNNCTGCHDDTHTKLDLREYCSYQQLWYDGASAPYVDTANPEQSILYDQITNGEMAQHVSSFEQKKILQWIEEGADDN